jgi:hypothetical protein
MISPTTKTLNLTTRHEQELPPHSLTVIRVVGKP